MTDAAEPPQISERSFLVVDEAVDRELAGLDLSSGIAHGSNTADCQPRRGWGERIMVRANRYASAAAQPGEALESWVRAGELSR